MVQERMAAFIKKRGVVLILAIPQQVSVVVFRIRLKNARLPTCRRGPSVSNNMTRNGRNGSKGEGSDAKDANHSDKDSCC
jgi:hypothetical protein